MNNNPWWINEFCSCSKPWMDESTTSTLIIDIWHDCYTAATDSTTAFPQFSVGLKRSDDPPCSRQHWPLICPEIHALKPLGLLWFQIPKSSVEQSHFFELPRRQTNKILPNYIKCHSNCTILIYLRSTIMIIISDKLFGLANKYPNKFTAAMICPSPAKIHLALTTWSRSHACHGAMASPWCLDALENLATRAYNCYWYTPSIQQYQTTAIEMFLPDELIESLERLKRNLRFAIQRFEAAKWDGLDR